MRKIKPGEFIRRKPGELNRRKPGELNRRKLCNKLRRRKTAQKLKRRKTAQNLKTSIQNEKHERKFICDPCGIRFMLKHHLVRHTKTCKGIPAEKNFGCEHCQKMFKSKKTLTFHQKKCTSKSIVVQDDRRFYCELCEDFKGNKSHKARHMKTVHVGGKKAKEKGTFKCEDCAKLFQTKSNMKRHMKTHVYQHDPPPLEVLEDEEKEVGHEGMEKGDKDQNQDLVENSRRPRQQDDGFHLPETPPRPSGSSRRPIGQLRSDQHGLCVSSDLINMGYVSDR